MDVIGLFTCVSVCCLTTCTTGRFPFVEAIGRNNAAPLIERFSKGGLFDQALASGIDHRIRSFLVFCPIWDKPPARKGQCAIMRIRLSRSAGDLIAPVLMLSVTRQRHNRHKTTRSHIISLYFRRKSSSIGLKGLCQFLGICLEHIASTHRMNLPFQEVKNICVIYVNSVIFRNGPSNPNDL